MLSTTAQLALLRTVGITILGLLLGYAGMAVGLIPLAGVGLFLLAGLVYILHGLSWWETARDAALYRVSAPLPTFAARPEPTFTGWLLSLWHQLASGPMWRAVAHLVLASIIGFVQIITVSFTVWSGSLLFT